MAKNLFKNITFCIPHYDIDLTKKQGEHLTKQIETHGGKVLDEWDHLYFEPIEYVLISPKARVQTVQKKI